MSKVRMSASNYVNKSGAAMVMVRIPLQDAAAIAVGRKEVIDEFRELIATKLNSERESTFGSKKKVDTDIDIEEGNDENTA